MSLYKYRIIFASTVEPDLFVVLICQAADSVEGLALLAEAARQAELDGEAASECVKLRNLQRLQDDGEWRFVLSS